MCSIYFDGNRLIYEYDSEKLSIEPWGKNSFRVRATHMAEFSDEDWALLKQEKCDVDVDINNNVAIIKNGKIEANISNSGKIIFYNDKGEKILEEYVRNRKNKDEFCSALNIEAREFKPIIGGDYELTVRFESDPNEKIFGMGQYQHPYLNLKGCTLELAHRNSQSSVPFALSSKGYGFLWNNPAIGEVSFSKNITKWHAKSTKQLDYWITAGDKPSEIVENYARATGTVPMMPEFAMGFWQSKLRYQTQDEILSIAREYKRRGLPISVIVIDFFHWTNQGDWKFDNNYWPEPEKMVKELNDMGIELMVSIWPTVDVTSENYQEMLQKGYLVRTERGIRITLDCLGNTVFFDPTNPKARNFVWRIIKKNYYEKGIKMFWLDEAEPEYAIYDFDNYRYYIGSNLQAGNIYPFFYAKTFFDGMSEQGQNNIINLVRCAWAGSQRFGVLVWSGDIDSSFESLSIQIKAGLNMGIAGIPWWTSDIGGFHGGNPEDPDFRELIIRWFQYATFCPVLRLHGDREPHTEPLGSKGGGLCGSGADNEVWSYGDKAYDILKKCLFLRERLKPYIKDLMYQAHLNGTPPMRPLFYDFPDDEKAWDIEDQFMFGPDILVAPVIKAKSDYRIVYLPFGYSWREINTNTIFDGGQYVKVATPIEYIPVFVKNDKEIGV